MARQGGGSSKAAVKHALVNADTPQRLEAAEPCFIRHGGKVVTIARFVEGLRQANGSIAGIIGMRWRRFLAFNTLGAVLWVAVWAGLGYLAGNHITAIDEETHRYQLQALLAVGLVAAGRIVRHLLRRRRTPEDTQS